MNQLDLEKLKKQDDLKKRRDRVVDKDKERKEDRRMAKKSLQKMSYEEQMAALKPSMGAGRLPNDRMGGKDKPLEEEAMSPMERLLRERVMEVVLDEGDAAYSPGTYEKKKKKKKDSEAVPEEKTHADG